MTVETSLATCSRRRKSALCPRRGASRSEPPIKSSGRATVISLLVSGLAFVAGIFIGAIGIGGVLLVTGLVYLVGVEARVAIAACMMGYLLTGAVGTWAYARAGNIRWPMVGWLCVGAMPAALLGALAANTMPPGLVMLIVGVLTAGAGLHALIVTRDENEAGRALAPVPLAVIGAVTGCLSALTGTGGPFVLVPVLMWLGVPILTAVGLSQAIQVPIAALATVGNAVYGVLDLGLGATLAVTLAAGTWLGARIAHVTPREVLRKLVAVVLAVLGCLITLDGVGNALQSTTRESVPKAAFGGTAISTPTDPHIR